jgi:hypothetical protein
MRAGLHTTFNAHLARAGIIQASFVCLTVVTARQVSNWTRRRVLVPQWIALLAVALHDVLPQSLTVSLEEAESTWREILGVPPNAKTAAARLALR